MGQEQAAISPLPIFATLNAYQQSAILKTAIELSLFSADQMFRNAGFSRNEMRELPPGLQRVIISYK